MDFGNELSTSIESTINLEDHKNYIDRYFTQKFYINVGIDCNDFSVLIHSNKLCVITLAPSHPIVKKEMKIRNIDFQVSKNVNRLDNKTTGKRKRNAQLLTKSAPICFIECEDNVHYTVSSPIPGKLIEINEKLSENPELLHFNYNESYFLKSYIAIIIPKHDVPIEVITKDLLSLEDYEKVIDNSAT
jgi:glycine cleavage system H lipoate-binding protein